MTPLPAKNCQRQYAVDVSAYAAARTPNACVPLARSGTMRATTSCLIITGALLAGCAYERAEIADRARAQMVGMSRESVLACMGPPSSRMSEGGTEVWSYRTGNGRVDVASNAHVVGSMVMGGATATMRYCDVRVVMQGGRVARLTYSGPTGGLLTQGEQCAYAVSDCVSRRTALAR